MNKNIKAAFGKEISFEEHKKLQLEILVFVSKFCDEHGIRYFLSDGTLIGAIRHKGYIPWDDDIDIRVPRPDLIKLTEIFNECSGSDRFRLVKPGDSMAQHYMVKIIDTRTVKVEPYFNYRRGLLGVDIDVFAVDGCPDDYDEFISWGTEIVSLNKRYMYRKRGLYRTLLSTGKDFVTGRVKPAFVPFLSCKDIVDKIDLLVEKYPYDESRYVCFAGSDELFRTERKEWDIAETDFEGLKFKIPSGFDAILRAQYGDYMQLPPAEQQIIHHNNNVFWRAGENVNA